MEEMLEYITINMQMADDLLMIHYLLAGLVAGFVVGLVGRFGGRSGGLDGGGLLWL